MDRLIAASSLVSNEPVLDVRDFEWTADLRRQWTTIRDEALALSGDRTTARASGGLIPLWRDGQPTDEAAARSPCSVAVLGAVPGLYDAGFARLAPGTHRPARRGPTKGLITCHLGLVVPRDGGARMRVRDRIVRWAEGETLIFDDTYRHEMCNEADDARIVLCLRFARPLRQPGRLVAGGMLRLFGTVV